MKPGKFNDTLLRKGPERSPANTGKDKTDFDEMSIGQQKVRRYSQNTQFRRYFSVWVMIIVPAWLFLAFSLVLMCGFGVCKLSDVVLSTMLATTTANILGLAYIVLKGMFPQERE